MKQEKGRKALITLICVLCLILAGLVGFIVYMETESRDIAEAETTVPTTEERTPTTTAAPTESIQDVTEETEPTLPVPSSETEPVDYAIETPWGTLYYPAEYRVWLEVQTLQAPVYTVSFSARIGEEAYPLFDLYFGGDRGDTIGMAADAAGNKVRVNAVMHKLRIPGDMSEADSQILYGMQESVSYLAAQLEKPQQEELVRDILIETPFCNLVLPGKWEDQVHLEIRETDGYAVCFRGVIGSREDIPLFDIVLDGIGAKFVGTLMLEGDMEIAVFCNTYEIEPGSDWSQEERDLAFSLLESVNDVLESLRTLDNFVPAE